MTGKTHTLHIVSVRTCAQSALMHIITPECCDICYKPGPTCTCSYRLQLHWPVWISRSAPFFAFAIAAADRLSASQYELDAEPTPLLSSRPVLCRYLPQQLSQHMQLHHTLISGLSSDHSAMRFVSPTPCFVLHRPPRCLAGAFSLETYL